MLPVSYNIVMGRILGERVVALRKRKGWSQGQLLVQAKRLIGHSRLSRKTISQIENNRYPSEPGAWLIETLATVLDTTSDYLLGLADDPLPRRQEMLAGTAPEPDLLSLIERLSRLPEDERKEWVNIFSWILDVSEKPAEGPGIHSSVRPSLVGKEGTEDEKQEDCSPSRSGCG